MKMTAVQKQFWVPLATFFVSAGLYAYLLGSILAILAVPPLAISVAVFGFYNFDRFTKDIREWMKKDD